MDNTKNQFHFGRVPIDVVKRQDVLAFAVNALTSKASRPATIATVNAQFVHIAGSEPRFASYLQNSDMNVADGMSLVFASRILGRSLPERITGVELTVDFCKLLASRKGSVFLLGGFQDAAENTARKLKRMFPGLGTC
jgi:N-acetylglucosaminyldiphosphoundecaprenol N-acetyl-beta-D-mannosaminyltransferase